MCCSDSRGHGQGAYPKGGARGNRCQPRSNMPRQRYLGGRRFAISKSSWAAARPRQCLLVAIRFVVPEQESESVAFSYSPVLEAVLSLHVLVAPKHHPLQHAWVRRMRTLAPNLRAEIQAFRFAYV